jgi:hypothetical protein
MRQFFFPLQDAAIYEEFPTRNTGLDEILEFGRTSNGIFKVRSLLEFDVRAISASIANGLVAPQATYELTLSIASASNLNATQPIELYAVSQSWVEGTGYYFQQNIQSRDGVTWNQASSGSLWNGPTSGAVVVAAGPVASVSASQPLADFVFDVTSTVVAWISGAVNNNGFLLQFATASEGDYKNWGNIKVFSKDTHTIYAPTLAAKWNDQIMATGSLSGSPLNNLLVVPATLKPAYRVGETAKVYLAVRQQYPLKTFDTQFTAFNGLKYLPSSSYFSIVDERSGATVIPFDDASRISTDEGGSYARFAVQRMYPLRHYRFIVKVAQNGTTQYFDDGFLFTVK